MNKVLLINYSVSGGVEYCGNIFKKWLEQIENIELFEIKEEDHWTNILKKIKDISPDIIIVNDVFYRSTHSVFVYKMFNPNVKILTILHSWCELFIPDDCNTISNDYYLEYTMLKKKLFLSSEKIFIMNYMPHHLFLESKYRNLINTYFPVSNEEYKIVTEWKDRSKNFVYLGSIIPVKFSEKFIDLISETNISIDCYGSLMENSQKYSEQNRGYI